MPEVVRKQNTDSRWIVLQLLLTLLLFAGFRLSLFGLYPQGIATIPASEWRLICWMGFRFDLLVVCLFFFPVVIALSLQTWTHKKSWTRLANWYWFLGMLVLVLIHLSDLLYFSYVFRRISWPVVRQIWENRRLGISLLSIHWMAITVGVITLVLSFYIFRKRLLFLRHAESPATNAFKPVVYWAFCFIALAYHWESRYWLTSSSAVYGVRSDRINLVINPVFELVVTLKKGKAEDTFFEIPGNGSKTQSPPYCVQLQAIDTDSQKNIIVFIMESVSREDIYDPGAAELVPFLDSLMKESLVFDNFYANGVSSPQGFDAIIGGLPLLFEDGFSGTPYAYNKASWMPDLLKEQGYFTCFYYGVKERSYSFFKSARLFGFEKDYGFSDYRADDWMMDGYYGIYDHIFFPAVAEQLKKQRQPFFSTIFNVSTHVPFTLIPASILDTMPVFRKENGRALHYYDNVLRKFFERIKTNSWYDSTIFLFVSDHFSRARDRTDTSDLGSFRIPFFLFDPSGQKKGRDSRLAQQLDIPVSILELAGIGGAHFSFGKPLFTAPAASMEYVYLRYGQTAYTIGPEFYIRVDLERKELIDSKPVRSSSAWQGASKIETDQMVRKTISYWSSAYQIIRENRMSCDVE
jgi:phosphoglycerol transferase MdoB-like AlkP superfamily enzyme